MTSYRLGKKKNSLLYLFIHSRNASLLSAYCEVGNVLDLKDTM